MDDLKKLDEAPQALATVEAAINKAIGHSSMSAIHYGYLQTAHLHLPALRAAVNAFPELLAVKAERDRAQQACEQMGERITSLENSLREIGAAIINGASDTLWMGDQISDETVVDFICNLTGDDPSLLGTFARAARNQ